ncbi:hypothetical protein [Halococcoides cellulosivorans]|uniref:YccF domain-containing protein n=1 Tax=Halococcoides cellulosivorans TaxID=1679096 RepID=A0A2R4WYY7_9EURY|nr:hypothetical protein [Halococcoides cellulosivorans]AWB26752.1 hypothetical protein HARCEL1_02995 [Halococcoides cellulosivorans]
MEQESPIVRLVWFLVVGWWATGVLTTLAWLASITIVGLPLGIKLINLVPRVVSLKRRAEIDGERTSQHGLFVRAVWFVAIGWWASGLWLSVAYAFAVSVIGLPVAIWMYDRVPWVLSLYRY